LNLRRVLFRSKNLFYRALARSLLSLLPPRAGNLDKACVVIYHEDATPRFFLATSVNPSFLLPLSTFLYAGNNHLIHRLGEPLWGHPYSDIRAVYSDQKPHTPAPPSSRFSTAQGACPFHRKHDATDPSLAQPSKERAGAPTDRVCVRSPAPRRHSRPHRL